MVQSKVVKPEEITGAEEVVVEEAAPYVEKRQILSQGKKYDVEVQYIRGQAILTKSVYREVKLPGTEKTTKVLVAAAGSAVQGY